MSLRSRVWFTPIGQPASSFALTSEEIDSQLLPLPHDNELGCDRGSGALLFVYGADGVSGSRARSPAVRRTSR